MGLGRVIATAAAAAPIVRNYLHRRSRSDDSDGTIIPSTGSIHLPTAISSTTEPGSSLAEDMARRPLLVDTQSSSRQPSAPGYIQTHAAVPGYGAVLSEGSSTLRTSPERLRRDSWLDRVPEEAASDDEVGDDEEWDLAEQGYYAGSYKTAVALYGLVPLTSLLLLLFLAALPEWLWPDRDPSHPTLPRSFPSPLPEFLLSAAFWSLSHHLRVPLYTLASQLCPHTLVTVAFNVLYVLLAQLLRLAAFASLRVRHEMVYPRPTWHDDAFRTVWWLALGWGAAEAATSVAQGYGQLKLYESVMVPVERVREILAQARAQTQWGTGSGSGSREYMPLSPRTEPAQGSAPGAGAGGSGGSADTEAGAAATNGNARRRKDPISLEEAIRLAVDQDVEQLIHLQEREELEEVYGAPVIYIPVFVPCLQRVDSLLFSLGFTLVLAWAYLLSPLSFPPGSEPAPGYSNHPLAITFPVVAVVHLFLSLMNSPPVLPRIGVHTAAYVGLLVGLGGFFTGLGLWGVLA